MILKAEHAAGDDGGFTLLEVIIAVTLVAIMAVALWAVTSLSIRSWNRGTEFIDVNQRHRSITTMLRKQMSSVFPIFTPPANTGAGQFTTSVGFLLFNGTESDMQFVSLNSMHFGENPGLTLISYAIERQPQGSLSLVEKEEPYICQDPEDSASTIESASLAVFENLESCTFEYYDPGDGVLSAAPGWVTEWDGKTLGRMPKAIAVTIAFKEPKQKNQSRRMIIPLMTAPRLATPYSGSQGGGGS
jgi:general secretion pathway protein J